MKSGGAASSWYGLSEGPDPGRHAAAAMSAAQGAIAIAAAHCCLPCCRQAPHFRIERSA